jgi:hypothetical protein
MFKNCATVAAAVSLALASLTASALPTLGTFRVNFGEGTTLDENFGQTWVDNVLVTPPQYACGRRLYNVDLLVWIAVGNGKSGLNPDTDIDVWLPRPNCPTPNGIVVEDSATNVDFLPPDPYTFPLEFVQLETFYGSRWIDKDGLLKPLGGAQLPYTSKLAQWAALPAQILALKAQIVDPASQSRAYVLAQQYQADVAELAVEFAGRVAERRRTDLPDREASLREMEDGATRELTTADAQLAAAARYARATMYAQAYVAADLAHAAMRDATTYLNEAEGLISTATQ